MIRRFSSRRQRLDYSFLRDRLKGATAYDRIAGYFSSSILEVAGEAIEAVSGVVRVICNSDINVRDVETAKAAQYAMRREWCGSEPEKLGPAAKPRFARLYEFLRTGKLQVRVLPSEEFGLIHGKAGVITLENGKKTSFIGSANETYDAWKLNYEIIWEDDSPEAVQWVQEEFDALWHSPFAVPLADFVVQDIDRLSRRTIVSSVAEWRQEAEPASTAIELPVFRKESGLWEHQKYFVKLAFDAHRTPNGARFILADMVGLGKTLQLALAAQLMALHGDKPVLVIVPRALLWQWQDQILHLLDMPSAVWTGKQWVDENGIEHPAVGPEGIKKCPRRVGIVSQGLIVRGSDAADHLKQLSYECIVVDEAHHARRKNLGPGREHQKADPNNLLAFLREIAGQTKSLLLATATPVQIHPIEAWDLVSVLATGNDSVLGNAWSQWRHADDALAMVMGHRGLPADDLERWEWIRNPFPPSSEGRDFEIIRRSLRIPDSQAVLPGDSWQAMSQPDRDRIGRLARNFAEDHNPFIRHIVRRTRKYLESTVDPETGEPYLKPVRVELFGEDDDEAGRLPPYLQDAYGLAEEFCKSLGARLRGTGFFKTLLLRRMGSTIYAGRVTAERLLGDLSDLAGQDDDYEGTELADGSDAENLSTEERNLLVQLINALDANQQRDPKCDMVLDYLRNRGWLDQGCIVFSQYLDSIRWLAEHLSREMPEETIGIYAGAEWSGVICNAEFTKTPREDLGKQISRGQMRLLLGTEAASEGLNLQRLGTLINLDLPWNPTRLEQRKGRIQRIGQVRDVVYVYNMRYKGSVEDRVHELLSDRLKGIYEMFGQIPDVLEDVWIDVALGQIERAKQTIDAMPRQHPFEVRYHRIKRVPWESCAKVLDSTERRQQLMQGW